MSEDASSRDVAAAALAAATGAARTAHDVAHRADAEPLVEHASDAAQGLAEGLAPAEETQRVQQVGGVVSALGASAAALAQRPDASSVVAASGQLASAAANAAGTSDAARAAQQAAQYANTVLSAASSARAGVGSNAGRSGASAHGAGASSSAAGHGSARGSGEGASSSRAHGPQLPPETYDFEVQDNAVPGWTLVSFEATEGLSLLYELTVVLEHEHELEAPQALLGKSVSVVLSRGDHERRFAGVVRRTEDLGTLGQHQRAQLVVVPALWTLGLRKTSRIFQGKTVPEIVALVLRGGLAFTHRAFEARLRASYLPREYCVQYNETDLAFVLRLLSEEGIGFYFEHAGTKELLVLFDDNGLLTPMLEGDAESVSVTNGNPQMHPEHTLQRVHDARALSSTRATVRDWDWTQERPAYPESAASAPENAEAFEVYSGHAEVTLTSYLPPKYGAETTRRQAQLRQQLQHLGTQQVEGDGNVTTFVPGRTFRLQDHAQPSLEQRYALVWVQHRGANHRISASGRDDAAQGYRNRFVATPHSRAWRPARLPRPRLVGVQTARVVGPESEEIYTDEHGRIKVRFHWDRATSDEHDASCWMRVAQSWAGQDWGFVFLPRVGMEVLVQFVDGNPDRPLITGCVYNGQNPLPYPQPLRKTQSVIKTRSTPGGGGHNELRFDDAKGEEEVYLRAQKDLNEMVRNNHTTKVGADQANLVRGSHTELVLRDQGLTVNGSRTKEVKGEETRVVHQNRKLTVHGDESVRVLKSRTEVVDQSEDVTVTGGRKTVVSGTHAGFTEQTTVHGTRKLEVTASEQRWVHENQDEHVGGTARVEVGKYELKQGGTTLTLEQHHVSLEAGDWIELKHGGGRVKIEGDGKVVVDAAHELKLLCGSASITLKASGEVLISGSHKVDISASGAGFTAEPAKVAVHGPEVAVAASGMNQITGAPVKLN